MPTRTLKKMKNKRRIKIEKGKKMEKIGKDGDAEGEGINLPNQRRSKTVKQAL